MLVITVHNNFFISFSPKIYAILTSIKMYYGATLLRIAIVHDALCTTGGAERLLLWMAKAFPEAPLYTSVYLPQNTFEEYKGLNIRTLPLAGMVKSERQFKLLYPLWLMLLQQKNFDAYDVVLTSSTYLAKFIRPAQTVQHFCYLHAPFRLVWKPESYSQDSLPTRRAATWLVMRSLPLLQRWDRKNTRKIPKLAANSQNIANEIKKVYDMPAEIIYPPVELPPQTPEVVKGDYYLSVSRLISHKRVDLSVQACTGLKKNLVVVGEGPEKENLKRIAGDTIHFVGRISDDELNKLYRESKGLIFASHEDLGLIPLEAQAWGTPVIAFGKGGALETIQEGISGLFFQEQEVESLTEAITKFETQSFDSQLIRQWVSRFDPESFSHHLRQFVTGG